MINLFNVSFSEDIKAVILDTLDSKAIASGPYVTELERNLGEIYPEKQALAVNDMTNGMTIILSALGLSTGDEVIASPFSCLATTSPMALLGIKPVWADVDPNTLALDLRSVEKNITNNTKAILIYHVAGYPSNVEAIKKLAEDKNLFVIEDCNSAFGSEYNNALLGSVADATVLSFYPNRQVGSIDGGAILFKDSSIYELAKLRRRYGVDFNGFRKPNGEINEEKDVATYGYSATMNNVSAGVINKKLSTYKDEMRDTRKNVAILRALIDELHHKYGNIKNVTPLENSIINNWVLFVEVENKEQFLIDMNAREVHTSSLHLRNNLYTCFKTEHTNLPGIDKIAEKHVALPCGHWLNDNDISLISEALIKTVSAQAM